jgi:mono/diheme cytochrome c family protein
MRTLTLSLLLALLVCAGCARHDSEPSSPASAPPHAELIQRGAYLARAGDCIACHTAPGGVEYTGGRAFTLQMGTIYSPNITPDLDTGIGRWSDDQFVRAMQKGVGPDGTHYYPAFPYNYFTRMPRADIVAIKAYLFSLRPVRYQAPESRLHFPYSQRWLMVFWNALFNPNERFAPQPDKSAQWNRGAYLVEGLGHCGACHTPMNMLQGPKKSRALAGTTVQGWHAYNITSDKEYGIGAWSDGDLAAYLSTGHAVGHGSASGPMAEAVGYSLSHLKPEDISAMVTYLKTVEPKRDDSIPAAARNPAGARNVTAAVRELASPQATGARLFAGACRSCHAWDGSGVENSYATLTGSRSLHDPRATNVTRVILEGTRVETANDSAFMPAFADGYSDAEIAALVGFTTRWFGEPANLSARDVHERRKLQD